MILSAADFAGRWTLTRGIDDHLAGQKGRFEGQALFSAAHPGALWYDEQGRLQLGAGPALSAERRYHWRFDGARVQVCFADGRAFHSFAPHGSGAGTDHPCGADYYTVRYDFTGWPEWQAVWRVQGPRKDYTSFSRYCRA